MKQYYPRNGRVILHVDMNSFYASVEVAYDQKLKGKPIAIAGNVEERRGIIITSSYEARAKGVKTTMPLWQAKKLCPQLVVLKPNFERYRKASLQMFELLREFTHLVEPVSIDEGYMDISECYQLGTPISIAQTIQKRLLTELRLPCSIGIAPNKFLAKMASDMKKPLGITVLRKRDITKVLWPLPVVEMHGVGEKTAEKLKKIGLSTIGELANGDPQKLKLLLGVNGEKIRQRANGVDGRQVDPDAIYDFKSIGNSTTLPTDTTELEIIRHVFSELAKSVSNRMEMKAVCSEAIQIMIRYSDRRTVTRSRALDNPIQSQKEILQEAFQLFKKHWNSEGVRLLGITAFQLIETKHAFKQLDLFSYKTDIKKHQLTKTMEELKNRFGEHVLLKGSQLNDGEEKVEKGTSLEKDFFYEARKKNEDNNEADE